ncbi:MAG: hypothetical protein KJ967_03350 [Elusimicrobia bacterium]|nr:hypothetical protein [Elusimicrobiota bacterium]
MYRSENGRVLANVGGAVKGRNKRSAGAGRL